jgi:magnesium-protoporphyrin O-methyltransferase
VTCCDRRCYEEQFDEQRAAEDLERYRRKGPDRTTRLLLEALKRVGVRGASLLDVGAGIGVVHHELLEQGAANAVHVDAAPAYIAAARQEAKRRGHVGRVEFIEGDFVALSDRAAEADVVTLDRVVCCYPNAPSLIAASARKARRWYGAVYPRDSWLQRMIFSFENFRRRRSGSAFRTYVHALPVIEEAMRAAGLSPAVVRDTVLWRIVVYARPA